MKHSVKILTAHPRTSKAVFRARANAHVVLQLANNVLGSFASFSPDSDNDDDADDDCHEDDFLLRSLILKKQVRRFFFFYFC